MSLIKLIDCINSDQYDLLRIFQELLVWDGTQYKFRTISNGSDDNVSSITCANTDHWDELRIWLEVVYLGDDGLLYLNIT